MEKIEIKKVIIAQKEAFKNFAFIDREKAVSLIAEKEAPFVEIITGIRRCGKSTLMQHIRENSQESNYVLNFDDNRLTGFTSDDFERLDESFHELYDPEQTYYFDEIQMIRGWEQYIRRLHNEGKKVFLTGSNASMLNNELGTHLTGRNIQNELLPFSFSEFLRFKNILIGKNDLFSPEKTTLLRKAFRDYRLHGGFPEFLQTFHPKYLKNLYENIIYRDIVARYNIRNVRTILELSHYLVSNISKETSYNALKNTFGLSNAITVKDYISYFENAYLLFSINRYDPSLKKQLANPKKIYTIDTGLANSISFQFSENAGRQLENIVYLQLRRNGFEIYYHRQKYECDFIIRENGKVTAAIQVCQSIENKETENREINGLLDAMRTYGLKEGLIITEDQESRLVRDEMTIDVLPVWGWLLE